MRRKALSFILALALAGTLAGCGSQTSAATAESSGGASEVSEETASAEETQEAQESTAADTSDGKNTTDHLNIAIQPIPGYLPAIILKETGAVEKALADSGYSDVKVSYTEFESGPPENESFASGAQDVGVMGNVPTLSAAAAGQARTILGVAYNGEKTEAVLVANDSSISSAADLKGKKIGLVIGSIAQDFVVRLLDKEGISSDDVQLVNLASTEQQNALATGQVDAIAVWQPMIAQTEAAGTGKVLVDGTDLYKCENLISGNTDYIEENPEIVKIFLTEYAKAAKEVEADPAGYAEKYADKFSLDADVVAATLKDMHFQVSITDEDIEDIQKTADWLFDAGNVKQKVDVASITAGSYADAAVSAQ